MQRCLKGRSAVAILQKGNRLCHHNELQGQRHSSQAVHEERPALMHQRLDRQEVRTS
jgi:hypothetical protein